MEEPRRGFCFGVLLSESGEGPLEAVTETVGGFGVSGAAGTAVASGEGRSVWER